jgi:hypothetical protein
MKKIIKLTESDLTNIIKRVIMEENNDFNVEEFTEKVIKYILPKLRGLRRESYGRGSAGWYDKNDKEILQYYNRFFLVDGDLFSEVQEKFKLNERELNRIFSKLFTQKFPNLKHIGVSAY